LVAIKVGDSKNEDDNEREKDINQSALRAVSQGIQKAERYRVDTIC
jgi:hypothetical protein